MTWRTTCFYVSYVLRVWREVMCKGSGIRVQDVGFVVEGSGFYSGSGCWFQASGFRVGCLFSLLGEVCSVGF